MAWRWENIPRYLPEPAGDQAGVVQAKVPSVSAATFAETLTVLVGAHAVITMYIVINHWRVLTPVTTM